VSSPLAACERVGVSYGEGPARIDALLDVSLAIGPAETVALWGRSGSGKTTLLHVLGGLVTPSSGTVSFEGELLSSLDAAARGRARARGIGYVFQGANLLPHFTAEENIAFALRASARDQAWGLGSSELLALVGLPTKGEALPAELSGGEGQRVAVARALAQSPQLLLCDEPTGHLDSDTGGRVLSLIDACREEFGFALVTATHDADVAARSGRQVELLDGRVVHEAVPA
jgi:ABC-type lipoprotein export system ATPase subunit